MGRALPPCGVESELYALPHATRVSLWLLLTGEFCQKQLLLWCIWCDMEFLRVDFFTEVWTDHGKVP